jgi:hypothetical protein
MKCILLTLLISMITLGSLFSQITLNVQYFDQNSDPTDLRVTYLSSIAYDSPFNFWSSWLIKVKWPKGSYGSLCDNNPITGIIKLEPTPNVWGFDPTPLEPTVNDGYCYCNIFKQIFQLSIPQMVEGDVIRIVLNNSFNVNSLEFVTGPVPAGVGSFASIEGTADGGANQLLGFNLTALPITLSEFKAVWNSGGWVDLKWTTVSEIGSDKFLVERSKDGRKWETIGTESARGAQDIRMDYFLKDLTPFKGINYYRLKMFDLDGSFKYSPIAAVIVENEGLFAKLYPNPASDFAMIDVEAGVTLEEISLYNLQGKLIKHQTFTEASQYRVELADIAQGEYFMEIVLSDMQIFTKKLILTGSRN